MGRRISTVKPTSTLVELIRTERARRKRVRPVYRYWMVRGDPRPPLKEYWCQYCMGFFGVPHDFHSDDPDVISCPFVQAALHGTRSCACIECVCAEELGRVRRNQRAARGL